LSQISLESVLGVRKECGRTKDRHTFGVRPGPVPQASLRTGREWVPGGRSDWAQKVRNVRSQLLPLALPPPPLALSPPALPLALRLPRLAGPQMPSPPRPRT
jgi:hypothetical protein